jgi:K+-transporting ATPase ATPase C chain
MKAFMKECRTAALATATLAVIACCLYPFCVWGLGQLLFPHQAGGSLLTDAGTVAGSRLIGQGFTSPEYFHPRPSAAGDGYDAAASGGSNLGPLSKKLIDAVGQRVADYRLANGLAPDVLVPADAVTASASGLDPHISLENAQLQVPRIAKARGMSFEAVEKKLRAHTEGRDLLVLGEPRVNVLLLNRALSHDR